MSIFKSLANHNIDITFKEKDNRSPEEADLLNYESHTNSSAEDVSQAIECAVVCNSCIKCDIGVMH